MDLALIEKAADLLVRARHTVVLTGAGISTESGVPDFRSPGGIWERYDPSLFFLSRFLSEPDVVWKCMIEMHTSGEFHLWEAKPNDGHLALAELERMGIVKVVITQNVDCLHQKAGSRNVIEFHGNMLTFRCLSCGKTYDYQSLMAMIEERPDLPPLCGCSGILKPDAVFFGEAIPQQALKESFHHAHVCDLMLVIGTSAQIEPAASLPIVAKGMHSMFRGMGAGFVKVDAHVIEINREPTPLTGVVSDFLIQGSAGEILSAVLNRVEKKRRSSA
ncbi:MAG TPA: NAD-dependent deacylase [Deltaproteobacteria bacterium]|nr:NAD-dependent deacylase [Deltaproteobacteria bacterium]HPP80387.1 NAD-dependent deacylase [Deltaproteobacteria bacterium]